MADFVLHKFARARLAGNLRHLPLHGIGTAQGLAADFRTIELHIAQAVRIQLAGSGIHVAAIREDKKGKLTALQDRQGMLSKSVISLIESQQHTLSRQHTGTCSPCNKIRGRNNRHSRLSQVHHLLLKSRRTERDFTLSDFSVSQHGHSCALPRDRGRLRALAQGHNLRHRCRNNGNSSLPNSHSDC